MRIIQAINLARCRNAQKLVEHVSKYVCKGLSKEDDQVVMQVSELRDAEIL